MTAQNRSTIQTAFATNLPDNTTALITPANVRGAFNDLSDSSLLPQDIKFNDAVFNLGLAFSVAGSALTCSLKQADGTTDPAALFGNVIIAMRSATTSSGAFNVRAVAAALSLVVPSTATLGHTSAVAGLLYWYLIDNAGALELAVSATDFGKSGVVSTTAIAAGSNTAATMYSTTARTGVAFRKIGVTLDTQTVAGTWAAVPSIVHVNPVSDDTKVSKSGDVMTGNLTFGNLSNFFAGASGGNSQLSMDSTDYMLYDRTNNIWNWVVGGTTVMQLLSTGVIIGGVREKLLATRTYYVRTDGSDSNNGLTDSAGGAFATWQKAANIAYNTLDLNGFDVNIQKGSTNGTWTSGVQINAPQVGVGTIHFIGDTTTPSNATIAVTSAYGFNFSNNAICGVKGFKLSTTTSGSCISTNGGAVVILEGKMEFGASAWNHMECASGGRIKSNGISAYTISGNAGFCHWAASQAGSFILLQSCTITLTGTPAFGTAFAQADTCASMVVNANTFSGAANSGSKLYNVSMNGAIQSGTTLPGGVAGTTSTGGQYI